MPPSIETAHTSGAVPNNLNPLPAGEGGVQTPVSNEPTAVCAPSPWELAVFGAVIGLLTGLSTASGTTVTLLGLLFTLIGGTFLNWFDKGRVSDGNRALLLIYSGRFSAGVLVGLFVSFGLRFVDQAILQPQIEVARRSSTQFKINPDTPKTKPETQVPANSSSVQLQTDRTNSIRRLAQSLSNDSDATGLDPAVKRKLVALYTHLFEIAKLLDDKHFVGALKTHASGTSKENFQDVFPNLPSL